MAALPHHQVVEAVVVVGEEFQRHQEEVVVVAAAAGVAHQRHQHRRTWAFRDYVAFHPKRAQVVVRMAYQGLHIQSRGMVIDQEQHLGPEAWQICRVAVVSWVDAVAKVEG